MHGMSFYQQLPPSHLLTGTIVRVDQPQLSNPRYLVAITDTNHPVPIEVYAWAAEDRGQHSAADRHYVGDEVILQDIGGVMSIVRDVSQGEPNAPQDFPDAVSNVPPPRVPDTILSYASGTEVRLDKDGTTATGNTGLVDISDVGFTAYTLDQANDRMNAIVSSPDRLSIRNSGLGMLTRDNSFVFGGSPETATELRRVMMEHLDMNGAPVDLTRVPLDLSGVTVRVGMQTGSLEGMGYADISGHVAFTEAIRIGLGGTTPPPATWLRPPARDPLPPPILAWDTFNTYAGYEPPTGAPMPHVAMVYRSIYVLEGSDVTNFVGSVTRTASGIALPPRVAYSALSTAGQPYANAGNFIYVPMISGNPVVTAAVIASEADPVAYPTADDALRSFRRPGVSRQVLAQTSSKDTVIRTGFLVAGPVRGSPDLYWTADFHLLLSFTPDPMVLPAGAPVPDIRRITLGVVHIMLLDPDTGRELTVLSPPSLEYAVIVYDNDVHDGEPVVIRAP